MFELNQLRQLLAISRCGTLSAAAEELHLSQPALTRSMQRLEEALGVPLFRRGKNKISFNETGELAVRLAQRVLEDVDDLTLRVQEHARRQNTISVASCAPGPMWALTPLLSILFPDMTVTSGLKPPDELIKGLLSDTDQIIITHRPVQQPGILCRAYVTEQLYISLPPAHPLAKKAEGICLSELDGQTMLLYADLGVWEQLCADRMQGIHFILQKDREVFADLINASVLPSFSSDLTRNLIPQPVNRVQIPILDPEASMQFYISAGAGHRAMLEQILSAAER